MSRTDLFDLLGVCLLALFGYAIWPPLVLAVGAAACLIAGRASHDRTATR